MWRPRFGVPSCAKTVVWIETFCPRRWAATPTARSRACRPNTVVGTFGGAGSPPPPPPQPAAATTTKAASAALEKPWITLTPTPGTFIYRGIVPVSTQVEGALSSEKSPGRDPWSSDGFRPPVASLRRSEEAAREDLRRSRRGGQADRVRLRADAEDGAARHGHVHRRERRHARARLHDRRQEDAHPRPGRLGQAD